MQLAEALGLFARLALALLRLTAVLFRPVRRGESPGGRVNSGATCPVVACQIQSLDGGRCLRADILSGPAWILASPALGGWEFLLGGGDRTGPALLLATCQGVLLRRST